MSPVSWPLHALVVPVVGAVQPLPVVLEFPHGGLAQFFLATACGSQQGLGRSVLRSPILADSGS